MVEGYKDTPVIPNGDGWIMWRMEFWYGYIRGHTPKPTKNDHVSEQTLHWRVAHVWINTYNYRVTDEYWRLSNQKVTSQDPCTAYGAFGDP